MSSIDSLKSLSTHSRTYWVIPIVKKLIQNSSCCFIAGCVLSCVKDPQDILLAIRGYIARFKYGSSAFARIFLMITRFSFIHCKKLFIAYSHVTSSYIRLSCTNSYSMPLTSNHIYCQNDNKKFAGLLHIDRQAFVS